MGFGSKKLDRVMIENESQLVSAENDVGNPSECTKDVVREDKGEEERLAYGCDVTDGMPMGFCTKKSDRVMIEDESQLVSAKNDVGNPSKVTDDIVCSLVQKNLSEAGCLSGAYRENPQHVVGNNEEKHFQDIELSISKKSFF